MKRTVFSPAVLLCVLNFAISVSADIARPNPSPSPNQARFLTRASIEIVPDPKALEARLEIPPEVLKNLSAGFTDVPASPSVVQSIARSSQRTIIAGLLLFLSLSLTGVWLARSGKRRNSRVVAALVLCVSVLGAAAIITYANAAPPGYIRWQNLPQALTEGRATRGSIDVAAGSEGSSIRLIIPMRNKVTTPAD